LIAGRNGGGATAGSHDDEYENPTHVGDTPSTRDRRKMLRKCSERWSRRAAIRRRETRFGVVDILDSVDPVTP
jgi:hypothetical protein